MYVVTDAAQGPANNGSLLDLTATSGDFDWMLQSEVNWDDDLGLFDDAPDIFPADFAGSDLTPSLRRYLDAALIANGWLPVVVSSPASGGQSAGKRPVGDDWQHGPFDVASVAARRKHNPLATNTGILCGATVGADNDLRDPEHAAAVNTLVKECLGDTGFQRVGAKGAMLVYANEVPIRKIAVRQAGADKTLFEFLGTGTQFVAYGEHPDGMAYRWLAQEPLTSETWELPRVTPEQIRDCTKRIVDYLIATGAYVGVHATGDIGADRELLKPAGSAGEPVTPEQLREMLAYIKPAAPMGEGEWLGLGLMLRHGQVPVEPAQTGEWFIELLDDWTSGKLWRERTKGEFTNPLYDGLEGTLDRLDGGNRERQPSRTAGNTTIGTVILRAKEAGYGAVKASDLYDKAGIRSKHEDGNETYGSRWDNVTARSPWDGWHQPPATFWDKDETLPRSPDGNVVMDYAGYAQHKTNVVVVECLEAVRDHGAKVLFCAGEAAHQFETERLPAACQAIGMDIEILTGSFWVAPICPDLRDPADVAGLFQWAASQGIEPSIVVVDTLAEATVGAEENSQKDVGPIMRQSYRIAKHWKALVRLIHHKTKSARPGEGGPRGGGGFAGGLDGMRECIYHEKDGTVEIWAEKVKGARAHFSIYRGTPKILVRNPVTGTTKEIMTVKRLTEAEQKAAAKKTEPTRGTVTGSAIGKALAYLKAVEGVSVPTPMLAGAIAGNGADKHTVAAVVKALGRGIADGSFLPYVTFMPDAGSRKPARWSLPDAQEE